MFYPFTYFGAVNLVWEKVPFVTQLPKECSFPDHLFPLTYFHMCFCMEWALRRGSCDFSEKFAAIIIFLQVVLPSCDKMSIWEQSGVCNDILVKKIQVFQGQLYLWIYTTWIYVKEIPDTSMHHWGEFSILMKLLLVSCFLIYDNFNTKTLRSLLSMAVEPLSSLQKLIGSEDFNLVNQQWWSRKCHLSFKMMFERERNVTIQEGSWC